MIRTGTRVAVLSGSCKKKTGPRKGSIGFVSQVKQHGSEITYIEKEDVFVNLTKIVFTRYGFESKERIELKYFINILPTFVEKRSVGPSLMSRSETVMRTDCRSATHFRQRLSDVYGKTARLAPSGIVVPIPVTGNVMDLSDNDFGAWLHSFLRDGKFIHLADKIRKRSKHARGVVDMPMLEVLVGLSRNSSYRKEMMPDILRNVDMKKGIVNLIRKVGAIVNRGGYKKKVEGAHRWLEKRSIRSRNDLIDAGSILLEDLYSHTEPLWKMCALQKVNSGSSTVVDTFKYVLAVKSKLLCLGQSVEEDKGKDKETPVKKDEGTVCKLDHVSVQGVG